jgi:hypothetical protein
VLVARVAPQRQRRAELGVLERLGVMERRAGDAGDAQPAGGQRRIVAAEVAAVVVDRRVSGQPDLSALVRVPVPLLEYGGYEQNGNAWLLTKIMRPFSTRRSSGAGSVPARMSVVPANLTGA